MDITILDDKQNLKDLYAKNTTGDIGEMLGVHQEKVRLALHRHGIPVRKKGARTERDRIERAVCRFQNILREYPATIRGDILRGITV